MSRVADQPAPSERASYDDAHKLFAGDLFWRIGHWWCGSIAHLAPAPAPYCQMRGGMLALHGPQSHATLLDGVADGLQLLG